MQIDGFPTILGLIGVISFFAYLIIGYFYLRRIEKQEGHLYKIEDRETVWKRLIKNRDFQMFMGILALILIVFFVIIQLIFLSGY